MNKVKQTKFLLLSITTLLLTLLLTACPTNSAPTANADAIDAVEGVAIIIDVLANDEGFNVSPTSVKITQAPANGTATVIDEGDDVGSIRYTSNTGFTGEDSFTYTNSNESGLASNEAIVTITVMADEFEFSDEDSLAYVQVDRMGMPAIATAVITDKDAYNAADPVEDAELTFAGQIVTNLDGVHAALDDDLTGLGLTPCTVNTEDPFDENKEDAQTSTCITQAAPLVVPDTLSINTSNPAGFPNGRMLTDPVIDVTLAVVLLELGSPCGAGTCGATTLADIPLNPAANDVDFMDDFPYLADPQ